MGGPHVLAKERAPGPAKRYEGSQHGFGPGAGQPRGSAAEASAIQRLGPLHWIVVSAPRSPWTVNSNPFGGAQIQASGE